MQDNQINVFFPNEPYLLDWAKVFPRDMWLSVHIAYNKANNTGIFYVTTALG